MRAEIEKYCPEAPAGIPAKLSEAEAADVPGQAKYEDDKIEVKASMHRKILFAFVCVRSALPAIFFCLVVELGIRQAENMRVYHDFFLTRSDLLRSLHLI